MLESEVEYYIHILILWIEKKGYDVFFEEDGDDCIDGEYKIIEINSSESLDHQLVSLLHECGHALIYENSPNKNFLQKKAHQYNTSRFRSYSVLEEIEAWNRAENLMKRLDIKIPLNYWESEKMLSLERYIKWAAEGE